MNWVLYANACRKVMNNAHASTMCNPYMTIICIIAYLVSCCRFLPTCFFSCWSFTVEMAFFTAAFRWRFAEVQLIWICGMNFILNSTLKWRWMKEIWKHILTTATVPYPPCCHFSDCRTFLANFGILLHFNCFRNFGRTYISPLKLILEHVLPKSSLKGPKKTFALQHTFQHHIFFGESWGLKSSNMTIRQRFPRLGSTYEALPSEKCIRLVTIGYQFQWLAVKQWDFYWCLNDLFYRFFSLHSHLEVEIRWWSEILFGNGTCFHSLWNLW